jgi:hypothetical protein
VRLLLRPRVLVVLALQAVALGLLATGAMGTSKDGPAVSAPVISTAVNVAHDTSVPLTDAPVVPNDPNRQLPELEKQLAPTVSPLTHDPVLQVSSPRVNVPPALGTFTGLKLSDLSAGYVPPDPVGDVGPTQYMQAVNGGLAVFSKDGQNLTGPINDTSFWSGLAGCEPTLTRGLSDPTVNYDQFDDRWVYSELSYDMSTSPWSPSYMCIAVSASGDATDSWHRYVFPVGTGVLTDYPKLGVWRDGYYLSFNDFNNASPNSFVGAGAMVVEKSQMEQGLTAQSVFVDLRGSAGLAAGGILPSDADGVTPPPVGAPDYYASAVDDPTNVNDQVGVWAFHVDWVTPANSTFANPQALHVAAYNGNTQRSVPQPGGAPQLDGLADNRLMNRLQYRNFTTYETLVTNISVDNGTGGLAPRWWEFRKPTLSPPAVGSWAVNQDSTFAPNGLNRWVGSVAMDGNGDMALGYSAGDASTAPEIRYTGRLGSDSLSTMQTEGTFAGGGGSQLGGHRWGDYSQMTVDPSDDCTFWYTSEFYPTTSQSSWETRISSFRFPSCGVASGPIYSVSPSVSGTLREGATLSATSGTWSLTPTYAYQWRRCDVNAVSCADIAGETGTTYVLRPADAGLHVRVKVTATSGGVQSTAISAATGTILPLAPVNSALPALSGIARVAQTITANSGTWSSYPSTATTFTYQWERCFVTCSSIPGATTSAYVLAAADAGATVRVGVTAHNIGGTQLAYSADTGVVQLPPGPVNTVAPVIGGVAQAGQTLTISQGTWTGAQPITYTYGWQSCSSAGANCVAISGQTTNSYAVNSGDIGKTLRASVTGTNSGGGTVFTTPATVVVTAAPAGGGGGSSSGGGGSSGGGSSGGGPGGALDLSVTGYQSPANPMPGENVTYTLSVDDLTPNQLAQSIYLNVSLPAGVSLVTSYTDRGSGCTTTSATQLRCYLDFLSGQAPHANVLITANVTTAGTQVFSATVTAQQSESTLTNNTLTLTYTAGAAAGATGAAGTKGGATGSAGTGKTPVGLNGDGTPTKKQDKKKPTSEALYTPGQRGATVKLRFKIYDDQGVAKATTTIKRGATLVGTATTGYGPVAAGSVYFVGWHVPANAPKGNYWFCVVATDRAGNKSAQSCAPLALK